jgi:serine phosphatase RsbU (regulator of sigma subunit)/AmiR/NasT family two-component response regulator
VNRETILVVEDETLVGLELKEDLERLGYFVPEVVESGEAVVPAVARHQPDLLLMDVRLRGSLDGIEAAFQAKAEFDVPVIYLTAYSDSDTLRRAAQTSPDGFLLKPFDERELAANVELALSRAKSGESLRRELGGAAALAEALDEPAIIADLEGRIAHANKAATAMLGVSDSGRLARTELSRALDLPRRGQAGTIASIEPLCRPDGRRYGSLVLFEDKEKRERRVLEASAAEANAALARLLPGPDAAGPGYRVGGFIDPCLSGSGDFFDAFEPGNGMAAFYSLDVMGHGVLASLMAFKLREVIPEIGRVGPGRPVPGPAQVLRALDARYSGRAMAPSGASFFTIAYGTIECATGRYAIARGGHPPALHLQAGGRIRVHYTKGVAVGILSGSEIEEAEGVLAPGDRLLLASDGLLSAFGGEGLLADALERLSAFSDSLRASSLSSFVEAFRQRSRELSAGSLTEDDISLLVIERQA